MGTENHVPELAETADATYCAEDNKLRLYPAFRLDREIFDRLKAEGFHWAPKQECFVAPAWTPEREDVLHELVGEVGDEDTTPEERARDRARRFEEYMDKRKAEAEAAHEAVHELADGIPMGQPILVGHHSEKRARKDAERIDNGMRKAIKSFKTSEYWRGRAHRTVAHQRYLAKPEVRWKRRKKLGTDKRRCEKVLKTCEKFTRVWRKVTDNHLESFKLAKAIANYDPHARGTWSKLDKGTVTPIEARDRAIPIHEEAAEYQKRWLWHIDNRIAYETEQLDGWEPVVVKRKTVPILNYEAPDGIDVRNIYHGTVERMHQEHMTRKEYAAINKDYKGTRVVGDKSHRVRSAMVGRPGFKGLSLVFLTDSKVHEKPGPKAEDPNEGLLTRAELEYAHAKLDSSKKMRRKMAEQEERAAPFKALEDSLKNDGGVKTVVVPKLFPTPMPLAKKAAILAQIEVEHSVLEPSAGTGNLVIAIRDSAPAHLTAIEVNHGCCVHMRQMFGIQVIVENENFLHLTPKDIGRFDRIVMNPPFGRLSDVIHIEHALQFLEPEGRLVAICGGGPRQERMLKPQTSHWERLPEGSFKSSGTNVNTVLLAIDKEA